MVGSMARPTAEQKKKRREAYRKGIGPEGYKKNAAYYVKMSEAIGEVKRISDSVAMDEAGQLIQTNAKVVRVGSGNNAAITPYRKIQDGNEFINTFIAFTDWIKENEYKEYPTKLNFSKYTGLSYTTIFNYLNKDFTAKAKEYQAILADTLTQGVNAGKYDRQMTIFCLKNWSGWADRSESVTVSKAEPVTKEQADALIRQYVESLPSE